MSKFGGGGVKCAVCEKTAYPAETVTFEKVPYHADCFRCSIETCNKKITPGNAAKFEDSIYCKHCFQQGGFAQKQRNTKWEKKEGSGGSGTAAASKFGGGGTPCTICAKTVYAAETLSFEKKIYHPACFKCTECDLKITASNASSFEDKIICRKCFAEKGFSQKQATKAKQNWTAKESSGSATKSKFGGGGISCEICTKTVYSAEQINFEKKVYHAGCFKCNNCTKKMTPSEANKFDSTDEEGTETREILCKKCFQEGGYRQKQAKSKATGGTGTTDARFAKFGGGGVKCVRCDGNVYPAEQISIEGLAFHANCLTCEECKKKLTASTAEFKKGDPPSIHCKQCFQAKGLHRADT